ncbi:hypothetical protein [Streptomyces chartreusis]|uniref:hypothetical protein n=1 Tax=Streptomyces chartreusis TaxID=1969 RepID=UPI003801B285
MSAGVPPEGASVIRIGVSLDSGRTYTRQAAVAVPHQWAAETYGPLWMNTGWPPCKCPHHRAAADLPSPRS